MAWMKVGESGGGLILGEVVNIDEKVPWLASFLVFE